MSRGTLAMRNAERPVLPAAPVVVELESDLSPVTAAIRLSRLPHLLLLDSAVHHAHLGRYSFVCADPVAWCQPPGGQASTAVGWLDRQLGQFPVQAHPQLPPFQGGVAGLLAYEFGDVFERMPAPTGTDLSVAPVSLGLYDVVIAWDHQLGRCWLVSQGIPSGDPAERALRAQQRANTFLSLLTSGPQTIRFDPGNRQRLDPDRNRPVSQISGLPGLTSNFSEPEYMAAVTAALGYIHAGDIFQVNFAQRLLHPAVCHSLRLYQQLRHHNPSTFAGYFDFGEGQVMSASPERLVSVRQGLVETRPIKGTRPRTRRPEVDLDVARQLRDSQKDCAENVMIVDLMRNDLSRVCHDDSVQVTQLLGLETYASVLHLVSAIEGRLRDGIGPADLLAAIFPGGSVTGAPKIRAMQIISELERVPRGAYCGSLGYFGLEGSIDLNILIRTITATRGWWQIPVGGGIVVDSDPRAEYAETWTKATGMLQAVTRALADHG